MAATSQRTAKVAFACDAEAVDDITVIGVQGELDLSTAPTLCAEVEATFRDFGARVLVDLSSLTFCDSTGLRALLGVVQEARAHRVWLRIVMPKSSAAFRALEIAGGTEFLPLVASREDGLAALAAS
jgi:anti-sigma B factor antagonist